MWSFDPSVLSVIGAENVVICKHDEHEMSSFLFSYDLETGVFTVPPGGDGFYFFSFYGLTEPSEVTTFDIRLNDEPICAAFGDTTTAGRDLNQAT